MVNSCEQTRHGSGDPRQQERSASAKGTRDLAEGERQKGTKG